MNLDSSSEDLLKEIQKKQKSKLKVQLWQLLAALGMENVGKSTGRALVSHFGTIDKILDASVEELIEVEDIGEKTAESIQKFFTNNRKIIDDLLQYLEPELPKQGKLSGKTFVLTGAFPDGGKIFWQKKIEDLGGKCGGSVSKKTDFVVVGTDAGSKADKAIQLNIKTLNIDELKKMV